MTDWRDLRWGIVRGLTFGILYSGVAVVLYAVKGSDLFERNGTTLATILIIYLLGGIVAGAILGVLRPWLSTFGGAAMVGVLAAMPVAAGLTMIATGKIWDWSQREWATFAFGSLFFGIAGAKVFWRNLDS